MIQKLFIACALLLGIAIVHAGDVPAGYQDLRSQTDGTLGFVLADGQFASGKNGWGNIDGKSVRVEPNGGVNGSPALRYERTDAKDYKLISRALKLKGGSSYRFGAVIRNENIKGVGGNVIIELYSPEGKWLRNVSCPTSAEGNCDWTELEYTITVAPKEKDCSFVIHLFMPRNSTGTTWFDRVFVEELGPQWNLHQTYPTHKVIDADGDEFRVYSECKGNFKLPEGVSVSAADQEIEFKLDLDGKSTVRTAKVNGKIASTDFGKLPEGKGMLRARLFDRQNRLLLSEKNREVTVRKRFGKEAASACVIDRHGRAIVNGKPYMPIGLYTGMLTMTDVERIAASPFNTIMSYHSPHMTLDPKNVSEKNIDWDGLRAMMDTLDSKQLKVLFSIKDMYRSNPRGEDDYRFRNLRDSDKTVRRYVELFRDHPALLAWYTCDEKMVDWLPIMIARRNLVNELDPNHPTWAVFYQPNVEDYLPMLDIWGGDQYPISRISEGFDHHMTSIDRLMMLGDATGVPTWNVPQAHNLNCYAPLKSAADYRDPTGEEMLAISLVQAIHGGKGFVFYSYFDFSRGPADTEAAPGVFEKRWKEACMAAGEIKKLEPFLMSAQASPKSTILSSSGKLRVRCFADGEGNYRLLFAGVGPGKTEGTVKVELPAGLTFRSRTGNTVQTAPGTFRFSGNDICSDIVELNSKR